MTVVGPAEGVFSESMGCALQRLWLSARSLESGVGRPGLHFQVVGALENLFNISQPLTCKDDINNSRSYCSCSDGKNQANEQWAACSKVNYSPTSAGLTIATSSQPTERAQG